ncbi:MAG TPA: FtsX-like permease family protein [Streptosporangiaceae bacterium]|jgi:hypothetical protein
MIRLGLRLTLNGGREAAVRLVLTAAAVALGACLLLITLAGINAVNSQNARYAWLATSAASAPPGPGSRPLGGRPTGRDPLWWQLRADYYGGQLIGRVDVAATGPDSPVPPGLPRLPGPGQFYASPALSRLLRTTPAAQLGDRFPGHQAGTIGAAALPAPNSLIIIVGHTPGQLARAPGAQKVSRIQTIPPSSCNGTQCAVEVGINADGIDLILSVVTAALLFPVLIFMAAATRLSAARREQRFAAMRLTGATPRQVSVISAIESAVAAVIGVAAGFGLFFLLRPAVAAVPFTGAPFFTSDLSLNLPDILLVAVGVPVAAAVAALAALRRVQISPLGVSRRVTPPAPRAWRLIPLLAGVAELAFFIGRRPPTTQGQIEAYMTGFLLILAGLIIAGPWLTMAGARLIAHRTSRAATLIAARRLADNPRAGFRAISGLVLALFVTTVAVGVITTVDANRGAGNLGPGARVTVVDQFSAPEMDVNSPPVTIPAATLARVRATQGVAGVAVIHTDPFAVSIPARELGQPSFGGIRAGLVSCAQLARTPALGRCPPGAQAAVIPAFPLPRGFTRQGTQSDTVWRAAAISPQRLGRLPALALVVSTNGSTAAIERARTRLESAYPGRVVPTTIAELYSHDAVLTGWQQLANVVVLASLAIAGCTLAASVAAGLNERKRPFSLLRLTGAPLRLLRRVVTLETVVPLLAVSVVSIGMGFLAAQLFLKSQLSYSLQPPGIGYYLVVIVGLAASLALIASTMPLLRRITGPETARNE